MPDYFQRLEDSQLGEVKTWYENLVRRTWNHGVVPVDGDLRGRVVFELGSISEASDEHLEALAAGASAESDSTTLIVDGVPSTVPEHMVGSVTIGAFEVEFEALRRFCESTDFVTSATDDRWAPDSLMDWPPDARSIVNPEFVDGWAMISPRGRWAFASFGSGDDSWIVGSQEFLNAYIEIRPDAVLDVLLWMHGDGSFLTSGWVSRPRKSIWPWVSSVDRVFERAYEPHMKGTLERFYKPEDAKWIWDVFVASDDAFDFRALSAWDDREEKLLTFLEADPEIRKRLAEIWRGA